MADLKNRHVREWLDLAQKDMEMAATLAEKKRYYEGAAYHCQQAVEKALKGFLIYHDREPERSHDLEKLTMLSASIDPGFTAWVETAEGLNPFSTAYRYPGEIQPAIEPHRMSALLQMTQSMMAFVFSKLPDVRPLEAP
jgi:HEPN domain-containing protein